jgi:hypothetical protein
MLQAIEIPSQTMRPFALRNGRDYVDQLKILLAITEAQMEAWKSFADALYANRQRMESVKAEDQPFGALEDRLVAIRRMRSSAAELFALLDPTQQGLAMRHLPLCCLPQAVR